MSTVWEDDKGIYVRAGGYIARPGGEPGYDHCYRMDSADLKKKDKVKAHHLAGSPLVKIRLDDGTVLHWKTHGSY